MSNDRATSNDVATYHLEDDGTFPNNERLPAIVYRRVIERELQDPARGFEETFRRHQWGGSWRNGIYDYHHYHSTAHEVLGVARGTAQIQLGGPEGPAIEVGAGDVILIPAGVAHKNLASSEDFLVVGAYPEGQDYDMNYGKSEERPQADKNIEKTPLPQLDPVFGHDGPVVQFWIQD